MANDETSQETPEEIEQLRTDANDRIEHLRTIMSGNRDGLKDILLMSPIPPNETDFTNHLQALQKAYDILLPILEGISDLSASIQKLNTAINNPKGLGVEKGHGEESTKTETQ